MTACCTGNFGEALQGVGGGQVRIGGGGDGERFAGVTFGLLGLTLSDRDARAGGERRCQTAADGHCYALIGPPPCLSHLASGQCDVGQRGEVADQVQRGLHAQPIRGHRGGRRRGRDIACRK